MEDEFNTTTNWWDSDSSSSSSRNRFETASSSSSSSSSSTTNNTSSVATKNLNMMGLGLSSPSLDWNQALLYRGFSLDQTEFSPHGHGGGCSSDSIVTCQGLPLSFQMDSSATNCLYSNPSNTNFQGAGILLGSDNSQNYHYGAASNNNSYGMNMNASDDQFLRTSHPKQKLQQHTHLHFSNNAPFWNASAAGSSMNDVPSPNFFPSLQTVPYAATQSFDEKPKHHASEVRDSRTAAALLKNSTSASKRAKNDQTALPLPASKARKEKTGDRIAALQQLVSPFGKTNTASVLSEAIEYIKFLHEQVVVLSTPYMKSGAPIPHQQNSGKEQDLRSRGLCLVPVSSTFPVTHETTADFWTPTFGGTF